MVSVPIDVGILFTFIATSVIFGLLFTGLLLARFRSPEFRMRLKRQKWVYALMQNSLGELREHVVELSRLRNPQRRFTIAGASYFWRKQDKLGRQTAFPYKKKLGAIFKEGMPFPEAFSTESLAALGGYNSEDFTAILESEVERNIVEAMKIKPKFPIVVIGLIAVLSLIVSIYIAIEMQSVQTALNHIVTAGNSTR